MPSTFWVRACNPRPAVLVGGRRLWGGAAQGRVGPAQSGSGGQATDGSVPILGITPGGLHQRVPLVFGAAEEVAEVAAEFQRG